MLLGRGQVRAAHALLEDAATLAPEGQCHGLEVPENGAQGPQEVNADDEVWVYESRLYFNKMWF